MVILRSINILNRTHNLISDVSASAKIVYPALANFISQIYNPKQFTSNPYFPVEMSNLLIAVGGYFLLDTFISKLHTYEFGYTGKLIDKFMKKHLDLIVFFIELDLLLNVFEFNTFFFVVGCLLLVFTLMKQANKINC